MKIHEDVKLGGGRRGGGGAIHSFHLGTRTRGHAAERQDEERRESERASDDQIAELINEVMQQISRASDAGADTGTETERQGRGQGQKGRKTRHARVGKGGAKRNKACALALKCKKWGIDHGEGEE